VVALLGSALLLPWSPALFYTMLVVFGYQVAEVGIALALMRARPRFIASLLFAPIFLVWKAGIDLLAVVGHRKNDWTRTERAPHPELPSENGDDSPSSAGV